MHKPIKLIVIPMCLKSTWNVAGVFVVLVMCNKVLVKLLSDTIQKIMRNCLCCSVEPQRRELVLQRGGSVHNKAESGKEKKHRI